MADLPFFSVDTDKFIADTAHLSDAEVGRYFRLLMLIWRTSGGRVPNDPAWLCKKLGKPQEAYESEVKPIVDEFCISTGNYLSQKKLKKEYKRAKNKSKKATEAANTRWRNEKAVSKRIAPDTDTDILNPLPPKGGSGVSDSWKGISCYLDLDDAGREQAKRAAPGYDLQYLCREYDAWIADKEKPRKPVAAFIAWCRGYYSKRGPA